ncbi:MAG: hypothetical protein COA78_35820 [Blastopirellula sp.]|nr:MAG: hypothetical protein COA78_35820 [Blastopirellula sp.]
MLTHWSLENSISLLQTPDLNLIATTSAGELQLLLKPSLDSPGSLAEAGIQSQGDVIFKIACSSNWETYHRGHDFVAINDSADDSLRTQVYFRGVDEIAGVELIASRQTSLLDKNGELEVATEIDSVASIKQLVSLEPGELRSLNLVEESQECSIKLNAVAAILIETSNGYSIALFIYPGDAKEVSMCLNKQNQLTLKTSLLGEHLEKGVIRQTRMRALVFKSSDADSLITDAYLNFVNSEAVLSV